jgi:hypothetical protein
MKDGDELIPMLKELVSVLTPGEGECDYLHKDVLLGEYYEGRLAERVLDIVEMLYSTFNILTGLETCEITNYKRPISWMGACEDSLRERTSSDGG